MKLPKYPLWLVVTALLVVAFSATAGWYYYRITHRIVWTMVQVSGDRQSGDAHLLEFPNGHVVLIDTGFDKYTRSNLIPYLDQRGIHHIDQLIITHAHRNHYGGIKSLLDHLDGIGAIYFNLPPKGPCDKEDWSTGCDYEHVLRTRKLIEESGTPLNSLATDQLLYHDKEHDISLEVVYVHDGVSPPEGETDINDTSAVLRLVYGTTSAIFSGDINKKTGKQLLKDNFFLKADLLTAPHHGVEGAASNDYLEAVDPEVMLVSDSAHQWGSKRGDRMRHYEEEHGITTYVSGIHGNVVVLMKRDGFEVKTQLSPEEN